MKPIHITALLSVALLCLQCDIFLDEPPNCAAGIAQYYSNGCVIVDDRGNTDEQITAEQLLCPKLKGDAEATGCEDAYYTWVDCLKLSMPGDCGYCAMVLDEFYACYNGYGFSYEK